MRINRESSASKSDTSRCGARTKKYTSKWLAQTEQTVSASARCRQRSYNT